ncbi:hypothetical protein ZEAMMB73_Zm00001d051036 [Zea mays]|uniref:Uncharacterized protein n=1 Tax=Zea mays TaxID=4577 RepID=A0A1D6Q4K5_MAIZE|nr:hypothetical protein ZEAMMB73_Zm00001d051036 [Zea mays]
MAPVPGHGRAPLCPMIFSMAPRGQHAVDGRRAFAVLRSPVRDALDVAAEPRAMHVLVKPLNRGRMCNPNPSLTG